MRERTPVGDVSKNDYIRVCDDKLCSKCLKSMEELIDFKVEPADDKPEMMAVTVSSRGGGDDDAMERTEFFFGISNSGEINLQKF